VGGGGERGQKQKTSEGGMKSARKRCFRLFKELEVLRLGGQTVFPARRKKGRGEPQEQAVSIRIKVSQKGCCLS